MKAEDRPDLVWGLSRLFPGHRGESPTCVSEVRTPPGATPCNPIGQILITQSY